MEEKLHDDFEKEQEILKKVRSDARKRKKKKKSLILKKKKKKKKKERKKMERESKLVEKRKEIEGERASLIERTENLFRAAAEEEKPKEVLNIFFLEISNKTRKIRKGKKGKDCCREDREPTPTLPK